MENKFEWSVDGLYVNKRDNAPDFVISSLGVNKKQFLEFISKQDGEFVNIDILLSKQGKQYAKLNTFKPKSDVSKQLDKKANGDIDPSDLPF